MIGGAHLFIFSTSFYVGLQ
ncbi:hypothetical protein KGM_215630A, partial [Danaus plexippus plexippus]